MTKDLVIWDLNGTLFDDVPDFQAFMNNWAIKTKYEFPEYYYPLDQFRERYGTGYNDGSLVELFEAFGFPDAKTAEQIRPPSPINIEFKAFFKKNPPRLFSDALSVIGELSTSHTLAILTSNYESIVKPVLGEHYELFKAKVFGDYMINNQKVRKPDPRTITNVIKQLDYTPKNIYHVGDNFSELETSINYANQGFKGKIHSIGLSHGFSPKWLLKQGKQMNGKIEHFDHVADSLTEVKEYILDTIIK